MFAFIVVKYKFMFMTNVRMDQIFQEFMFSRDKYSLVEIEFSLESKINNK